MCVNKIQLSKVIFNSNTNTSSTNSPALIVKEKSDKIVQEVPVALVYNGISHTVMMTLPKDLEDFALGFSLAEGIISSPRDIFDIEVVEVNNGIELQIELASRCFVELKDHRRSMAGRTGCGICGTEQIENSIRQPQNLKENVKLNLALLPQVLNTFQQHQPVKDQTGATHAAGFFDLTGNLLAMREDIGRHIALDKILGWHAKERLCNPDLQGFIVVSSRGSYEMIQKTAQCGVEILVTMSAVTALAMNIAQQANLTLIGFAKPEQANIYSAPQRLKYQQVTL